MDNNIPAGYNSDGRKGLDFIDLPGRSIPTKKMLQKREDDHLMWFSELVQKPTHKFTELAESLVMRQEDWDGFWKTMHKYFNYQENKNG